MPQSLKKLIISCWDSDPNNRPSFQEMLRRNVTQRSQNLFNNISNRCLKKLYLKVSFLQKMNLEETYGKKLSRERFGKTNLYIKIIIKLQWIVPWNDFLLGFTSALNISSKLLANDIRFACLKQVLGADTEDEIVSIENYAHMLEWTGPVEKGFSFLDNLFNLLNKPYFHGNVTLYNAEKALSRKKKKGTFLVRFSSTEPGAYTLSFVTSDDRIQHLRISHRIGKGFEIKGHNFATLDDLVR